MTGGRGERAVLKGGQNLRTAVCRWVARPGGLFTGGRAAVSCDRAPNKQTKLVRPWPNRFGFCPPKNGSCWVAASQPQQKQNGIASDQSRTASHNSVRCQGLVGGQEGGGVRRFPRFLFSLGIRQWGWPQPTFAQKAIPESRVDEAQSSTAPNLCYR